MANFSLVRNLTSVATMAPAPAPGASEQPGFGRNAASQKLPAGGFSSSLPRSSEPQPCDSTMLPRKAIAESARPAAGQADEERLRPRVERNDEGFWVLKQEYRTGSINPQEKLKLAAEPMKLFTEGGLDELAKKGFAAVDSNKAGKDDIDVRLKWLGLFHRRKNHYGRFMMRLKLPNGITNSTHARYLASVIEKYGKDGCADITTRQNWQIRGVVLEEAPAVIRGLQEVGLTSIQSGMDNVRNGVGSPLAGIDPLEILDTRPYNQELNDYIIARGQGNPEITNLPRKWNVCVVGTHDLYEHPHINDLAYIPAIKDGVLGFNILVGGFFSQKRCAEAVPLDAWVPASEVVPVCKAVLETFRDLGSRGNRQKCRMMWLIDELGVEGFREEVEKRMGEYALQRAAPKDLVDPTWQRRSYFGVHPQKQPGLSFIGLHVPVGRLQADDLYELARLCEEYGDGEMRLTVEQNVIIPNVPNAKMSELLREPLLQKFSPVPGILMGGLVSCTGNQFCGLALIETKARSVEITQQLEATMELDRPVRMHWTGCPNTCAQVQVADLGFMGAPAKDDNGKPCEGVNIYMGGRIGADSHLGDVIRQNVPVSKLLPVVQDLLVEHFGARKKMSTEISSAAAP